MDFTFDLSQTPVIGRKYLNTKEDAANSSKVVATPRRSLSLSPADVVPQSGWKRPWMCQVISQNKYSNKLIQSDISIL